MSEDARRVSIAATLGFMAGFVAMALFSHVGLWRHRRHDPERLLRKFTKELSLRQDQQGSVKAVLVRHAATLDALQRETDEKISAERTQVRLELRALLDAEQQARFDERMKRSDARRKAREEAERRKG